MHLGRLPSGLPAGLRGDPDHGPVGAWQRTVEHALTLPVRAVALAGDMVHQANAAFGAYGPLEKGIRELTSAGIAVCAVAGNHDAATLPRMADRIDGFTLLGAGGTWAELRLDAGDGPAVRLVGWSFPREHHAQSPFATRPPAPEPGVVTLGILHCDLGASRSSYAPVTYDELRAAGYDRWFLGHEHVPGNPASAEPFYLGSLTPLDPSEMGAHGPVLVTVPGDGRPPRAERLPLAPVRWDELNLPCSAAEDPRAELPHLLSDGAVAHWRRIEPDQTDLRALGLRVTVTGQAANPETWDRACRAQNLDDLIVEQGLTQVFIQRLASEVTATRDLQKLADGSDPAGLLARRILVLEEADGPIPHVPDPAAERKRLLALAQARLEAVDRRGVFDRLDSDPAYPPPQKDSDRLPAELARIARRTLDSLLAQKGGGHATD